MRFPFFIVILLSALSSRAEILSGTVKDKADSKELPYVNYYVYANNSKSQIQGISNEHYWYKPKERTTFRARFQLLEGGELCAEQCKIVHVYY